MFSTAEIKSQKLTGRSQILEMELSVVPAHKARNEIQRHLYPLYYGSHCLALQSSAHPHEALAI